MNNKKKIIRTIEDMQKLLSQDWALGCHDKLWTTKGGITEQSLPKLPKN